MKELVGRHYSNLGAREWRRLVRNPYHRLEFDTTLYFLRKYLPEKGLVLDAGGGSGRYTIELARLGYDTVLLDLASGLLSIARQQIRRMNVQSRVKKVVQGSIDDLSTFGDETFDAVACLGGPLCHLPNAKQRDQAIGELFRVVKEERPVFISVIGRLGALHTHVLVQYPDQLEGEGFLASLFATGDFLFHKELQVHLYLPDELKNSLTRRSVEIVEMAGLEGFASGHPQELNRLVRLYPKAWEKWWEIHLRTCTLPSAIGMSEHFMAICRKSKAAEST